MIVFIAVLMAGCSSIRNEIGFKPMFDGKTLNGWEGDPKYWRIENTEIIGEVTPATILKTNTFLIWKGAEPSDFELKVSYKISSKGNSGVNYRSSLVDTIPFALKGYQQDIDGKDKYNLGYPRYSGQNYEERGGNFSLCGARKLSWKMGSARRW